ncbi:MAG: hypothetical protein A2487_13575 [Candidatus Raymondbacteria bacterium RifOxyC12_full_50_8]|nr:MAG: hypothetical protein A2487_13575 [Candidatus Raymondbacteria bacterium RifOxyC12_full_50_8]
MLCLNVSNAQTNNYTVDSNTIALWRFNEATGNTAYDISGNGNHIIITGEDWVLDEGAVGLRFNGTIDSCYTVTSQSLLHLPEFTIEARIKIISFTLYTGEYFQPFISGNNTAFQFGLTSDRYLFGKSLASDPQCTTNQWIKVSFDCAGMVGRLFINDSLVACDKWMPGADSIAEGIIKVGFWGPDPTNNLLIDEIRISNTCRHNDLINKAPVFNPAVDFIVKPDTFQFVTYLTAQDTDHDQLHYDRLVGPQFIEIDIFSASVTIDTRGVAGGQRLPLSFIVGDGRSGTDTVSLMLIIPPIGNRPPAFMSYPQTQIAGDTKFTYIIRTSDPDSDTVTCALAQGPTGMSLNGDTLSWIPSGSVQGDHNVSVVICDEWGKADTLSFVLTVVGSVFENRFDYLQPFGDTIIYENTIVPFYACATYGNDSTGFTYFWTIDNGPVSTTHRCTLVTTGYQSAGEVHFVSVTAYRDLDSLSYTWRITIRNTSLPPVLVDPRPSHVLWGDSALSWTISDPDFHKEAALYKLDFYEDSLFNRHWGFIDSISDTFAIINKQLEVWMLPESAWIYWRVSARDTTDYNIGVSKETGRFFFMFFTDISVENAGPGKPAQFELGQNTPNPFNPVTVVPFAIAQKSPVSITIRDIQGRLIIKRDYGIIDPGYYRFKWDVQTRGAGSIPTGVYIYTLKAGTWIQTKKMLLIQ